MEKTTKGQSSAMRSNKVTS